MKKIAAKLLVICSVVLNLACAALAQTNIDVTTPPGTGGNGSLTIGNLPVATGPSTVVDSGVAGGEVDPGFGTMGLIGKSAVPLLNGADDDEANETDD